MSDFRVRIENLPKVAAAITALPEDVEHARRSALNSVGFMLRGHVRNHVEYGGTGWAPMAEMTKGFKKKRGSNKWSKRSNAFSPYFYLGKFARYRLSQDGQAVLVFFGKSRKGQVGTRDPWLNAVAWSAENGRLVQVTRKMRRAIANTVLGPSGKPKRNAVMGQNYFALRKETSTIRVPARPIFKPVYKKNQNKIDDIFAPKFFASLQRQQDKRK